MLTMFTVSLGMYVGIVAVSQVVGRVVKKS